MVIFGKTGRKKEAFIDRIKYDGPRNGAPWLVYKYPSEKFVLGSQLIVNQGQEALFFKGGEALDLFGPGTHTLHTGNLPLLSELVNLPFGGDTPFTAEIYYINKTSKLNMNWGTATAFPVEDPKYGRILSIRSHGTYGLRINDTRMFIVGLIGAVSNGETVTYEFAASYFSGLLTSKIKNVISAYMIRRKISFLEVTGYLDEISGDCEAAVKDEFERFGAEIVNFYVETISPPKEELSKLRVCKERAETSNMGAAGNIPQNQVRVCPHCGVVNPPGQKFCGACGKAMTVGLRCPACGNRNPMGHSFCGECGTKLTKRCPACGKESEPSQKFCGACGMQL